MSVKTLHNQPTPPLLLVTRHHTYKAITAVTSLGEADLVYGWDVVDIPTSAPLVLFSMYDRPLAQEVTSHENAKLVGGTGR